MTIEERIAKIEATIQTLKDELYVDGYFEWVFDDVGWIAHYTYRRGVSSKRREWIKKQIQRGYNIRNNLQRQLDPFHFYN